jgi:N-acetylglucosamine kinase-like BadF-type ATPase
MDALSKAGMSGAEFDGAHIGSAAVYTGDGERHLPFFAALIPAKRLFCEGDIVPVWFGAVRMRPAVVSIVGTGALTYVCRKDGYSRVDGLGWLLGDAGSGYSIGLAAVRSALAVSDGRENGREFLDAILRHYGIKNAQELSAELNRGDLRRNIASATLCVFDLYSSGNKTAETLLNRAAEDITTSITAALKNDGEDDSLPLVLSGGVVQPEGSLFRLVQNSVLKACKRISRVVSPEVTPVAASAALAMQLCGNKNTEILLANAGR